MIYCEGIDVVQMALFPQDVRKAIYKFWSEMTLTSLGNRQLLGEKLTVNVFDTATNASLAEAVVEIHRKYVDLQTVLTGEEVCYCLPFSELGGLKPRAPFDVQKDAQLFQTDGIDLERATRFTLRPGRSVVFFPGEGHLCSLCPTGQGVRPLRKVVFKIAADSLLS